MLHVLLLNDCGKYKDINLVKSLKPFEMLSIICFTQV